ncbi:MAG: hypothetical protein H7249_16995 [Chitinophagaceae bacterium]|nr:hypothetical protein [Oligoflexus sp.]
MKRLTLFGFLFSAAFTQGALAATSRSVFLNGVDISSTKNQSMQQVNVNIDSQGNVYIEAPHYEAQQETTFVPLGRQGLNAGRIPQHRAPGPLPGAQVPAVQGELAPASDSRDTLGSSDELKPKEGARIPSDGNTPRNDAGPAAQQNTPKNPGTH